MSNYDNRINYMWTYYYEELERKFLFFTENKKDVDDNKDYNLDEIKKYFLKYKNTAEFWWMIWYVEIINKFQFSFNIYNRIYLFLKMIVYILFILILKILWKNKEYYRWWIWAYLEWMKLLKSPIIN